MRSSKSRSRNKQNNNNNRNRSVGNIINRVFDSSGPEGKVRGTPQQIIDKYTQLARDAQLSNDRVAAENFQQHAEHYTRMLGEAMREMEAQRQQNEGFQRGNGEGRRDYRDTNSPEAVSDEPAQGGPVESEQVESFDRSSPDPASLEQPDLGPGAFLFEAPNTDMAESGLVETPEAKAPRAPHQGDERSERSRRPKTPRAPREPQVSE